jgi:hypothetical protein
MAVYLLDLVVLPVEVQVVAMDMDTMGGVAINGGHTQQVVTTQLGASVATDSKNTTPFFEIQHKSALK